MFFKNLAYSISLPFKNLIPQARAVQIYRLVSGLVALVFVVITLIGSLFTKKVYIARIDCSHLDVSNGLYESLRSTVSSNNILESLTSYYLPQDHSLTDSEIKILTAYSQAQVESAPQFITTSLWSWCSGNYNLTSSEDFKGNVKYKKKNISMNCIKSKDGFALDYKNVLSDIGLNSIIAYAYSGNPNTDGSYQKVVHSRKNRFKMVPATLVFCAASQLLVFVLTYLVYSNRGSQKDLTKIHPLFLNIVAFVSLASFLSIAIGAGIITSLFIQIRNDISNQLNSFGIYLHLGSIWFSFLWTTFSFSFLSMTSWAFPLWCANPSQDIEDEEFATYNEHVQTINRANSTKSNIVQNNNSYKRYNSQYRENSIDGSSSDEGPFIRTNIVVPVEEKEDELRKLGETLSRKPSVRHIKWYSKSKKNRLSTLFDDETVDLLYDDDVVDDIGNHYNVPGNLYYQEETYDGCTDGHAYRDGLQNHNIYRVNDYHNHTKDFANSQINDPVSKKERIFSYNRKTSNSNNIKIKNMENQEPKKEAYIPYINVTTSNNERVFSHNSFMVSENKRHSQGDSILNDEEMNILDLNDYVDKL